MEGFPGGSVGKESTCNAGDSGLDPWVGKIPWKRAWQPIPVFLPGESPWTEESGGMQSMGSQRVGHDWATKYIFINGYRKGTRRSTNQVFKIGSWNSLSGPTPPNSRPTLSPWNFSAIKHFTSMEFQVWKLGHCLMRVYFTSQLQTSWGSVSVTQHSLLP